MRVFFNNFAIFRDFSVIFSDFVPDSYPSQGRPLGAPFLAEGRQIGEGFNVTPLAASLGQLGKKALISSFNHIR